MTENTKTEEPKVPAMVTFIPSVTFYGRPTDDGDEITFTAGVKSIPVPAEYAALIREKKLTSTK